MPGRKLEGALREERRRIAAREPKFRQPFRRDGAQKENGGLSRGSL